MDATTKKKQPLSPTKTGLTPQKKKPSSMLSNEENSDPNVSNCIQTKQQQCEKNCTGRARDKSFRTNQLLESIPSSGVNLSEQQKAIIASFCSWEPTEELGSSHNLFITGGAGTGKSFLLLALIKKLKSCFGNDSIFLTATTGKLSKFNGLKKAMDKVLLDNYRYCSYKHWWNYR